MATFMCNNFIQEHNFIHARYQSSNKLYTHSSKRWDSSTPSIFIHKYDHCICVINFIHVGSREWIQSGFHWVRRRYHCGELQHNAPSQNQLPLFTNLALDSVWTIRFQIRRLIWIQDNSLDFSSSNNKKIWWMDLLVKGIISKELLRMCQVNSVLVIWFWRTRTIVTSLSQWTWSIMNVWSVCSAHCILTDAWYPCGLAHTHLMSFVGYVLAWT